MANKILIDTDFLFALNIENDSHHKHALEKIKELGGSSFYITQLTLPEAATVISYKVSQNQAVSFLRQARNAKFNVIQLDEIIVDQTDQIFMKQSKKGTSWIDCLNVATIETHGLDGILSFDLFYKKMGIKMF